MRLSSLKSWSASVLSGSVLAPLTWDSYTGVTLWQRAMAFTASWIRLLTLLRTFGAGGCGLREGVELALLPFDCAELTWRDTKLKQQECALASKITLYAHQGCIHLIKNTVILCDILI